MNNLLWNEYNKMISKINDIAPEKVFKILEIIIDWMPRIIRALVLGCLPFMFPVSYIIFPRRS